MSRAKTPTSVGERIRVARKTYGMSQEALGENIRVTRAAISQYEKGRIKPRDEVLALLARTFHVDEAWFTTGAGKPPSPIDVPLTIPEISLDRLTKDVVDPRTLVTGAQAGMPTHWLAGGPMISPAHLVTFVSPVHVSPIHEGDHVLVDTRLRLGPPGVFLVIDERKGPTLRKLQEHPDGVQIIGRVVGFFRLS
jgi:transcriptional regulator with XRE-family HTH domain